MSPFFQKPRRITQPIGQASGFVLLEVLVATSIVASSWIALEGSYYRLVLKMAQIQVKKVAIVIGIAWSGTNCVIIFCKGIASKRLWCKILYFILSALNGVSCFDNSRSLLSNFYWRIPFSFILSSRSLALILYLVEILLLIQ
jgi:hypothetical protein